MKRARFTDELIVRILQEADKSPAVEVAKRHVSPMQFEKNWLAEQERRSA
jgi:hypothetical protein